MLSDLELASVWRAADETGYPFGPAVQLLTLTACRREEILGLSWHEVDLEGAALRLPPERTKVKEGRLIPLSPPALHILSELPRFAGGNYLFGQNGCKPFRNAGHAKVRLDRQVAAAQGLLPPWRLHDLRRTAATGLQRLGFRLEVIEATLGHMSGSRSGIVGVYQRHRFDDEVRAALGAWGQHVVSTIEPVRGAVVVALTRADGAA